MSDITPSPWEILEALLADENRTAVATFLEELPLAERIRALSRMSRESRVHLLQRLDPEVVADLIAHAVEAQAAGYMEDLSPTAAAAIVEELPSDIRADLIAEMRAGDAEAILQEMPAAEAEEVRSLASYPADSAGGIMVTELVSYPETMRVSDVLDDLRAHGEEYSDLEVQYAYITADEGQLVGILPLRDLLFASRTKDLSAVMIREPHTLRDTAPLDEVVLFFEEHAFVGAPVVDADHRLVGVVRRSLVRRAVTRESTGIFLKISGIIGGEELRTLPLWLRSVRRLSWLSINIVLNIIAASVIALHQDTLAAVIALAVFLPIISDMSGCSGNQAVAVSMRELTLGLVKPRELLRVLLKESSLGIINGLALGVLLGGVAFLWKQNPVLGLVVGGALAVNTVIAVTFGGLLPLLLKRFRMDPALVSGPILTTVTDMCGFLLVLTMASSVLPLLASG
jgi:magnesium transporter